MIAVHDIKIYKTVIQGHETIFIQIIPCFDNHANSSWYLSMIVGNMIFPVQIIVNDDPEELYRLHL